MREREREREGLKCNTFIQRKQKTEKRCIKVSIL